MWGQVEVWSGSTWGTICDSEMKKDDRTAEVLCRSAGYRKGVNIQVKGQILLCD